MTSTILGKKIPIPPHVIVSVSIALIAILLLLFGSNRPDNATENTSASTPRSNAISMRFEALGELSTQSAYITSVQIISNSRTIFGITVPFTQSKYIYSYDCTVKAGIDFSKVAFTIDPVAHTITVTLPPSYITNISVDENSLCVYDESQNIFSPLKLTNMQDSRLQMQEQAELRALETGILEEASQNAKLLISTFLLSNTEYADYTLVWAETVSEQEE